MGGTSWSKTLQTHVSLFDHRCQGFRGCLGSGVLGEQQQVTVPHSPLHGAASVSAVLLSGC